METLAPFSVTQLEKAAIVLKTIAHPLRLSIVELLTEYEELSVNTICEYLNSEQSLTSHHLNTLRSRGLVTFKRKGQNIYYSLKLKQITKVLECMQECNLDDL